MTLAAVSGCRTQILWDPQSHCGGTELPHILWDSVSVPCFLLALQNLRWRPRGATPGPGTGELAVLACCSSSTAYLFNARIIRFGHTSNTAGPVFLFCVWNKEVKSAWWWGRRGGRLPRGWYRSLFLLHFFLKA